MEPITTNSTLNLSGREQEDPNQEVDKLTTDIGKVTLNKAPLRPKRRALYPDIRTAKEKQCPLFDFPSSDKPIN